MEGQKKPKTCLQRVERKKGQLKALQVRAKRTLQRQEQEVKRLRMQLKGLEGAARQTEDYCEGAIVGVIDSLQSCFESLRRTIWDQQQEAEVRGRRCLKSLQANHRRVKKRTAELQRLAQLDDGAAFLKHWPKNQRLCRDALRDALCDVSREPLAQFELTKRAVDEFEKQLKELCNGNLLARSTAAEPQQQQQQQPQPQPQQQQPGRWLDREAVDDLQPDASSLTAAGGIHYDLTAVPRTREDFLQYGCSLTFDVTTAHQDLLVSAGGREVRLQASERPARHPQRFLRRRQLLCREALRAARCYYEVEVEGDHAEIALAYAGMQRKCLSSLSAFGGNNKSWSLDRSSSYSVSHGGASVRLKARPTHRRVGVYLQLQEGLLSFYEVADTMTLLYRVEASFSEPLYPGFWLGEKCCIRICDLGRVQQQTPS